MSALAKQAREKMKAKAKSLAAERVSKVDSSDWTPPEALDADVKTGARPISRRQFKRGGKVIGKAIGDASAPRADRKPRKAGGRSEAKEFANAKVNRDVRAANEEREGKKHVGGFKAGGKAKRATGGAASEDTKKLIGKYNAASQSEGEQKLKSSEGEAARMEKNMRMLDSLKGKSGTAMRNGGKAKRATGGGVKDKQALGGIDPTPKRGAAQHYKKGGKTARADGGATDDVKGLDAADPRMGIVKPRLLSFGQNTVVPGQKRGGKVKRATGGMVDIGAMKKGPKSKKGGKTDINITINTKPDMPAGADMTMPPPPPAGVPIPMGPPPGAPGAPGGASPPAQAGGMPPMPPPMPPPPAGAGAPPMPRKRGGRVAKQIGGPVGFKGAQTGGMPAGAAPAPAFGGMPQSVPPQFGGAAAALARPAAGGFRPGAPVDIAGPGIRPAANLEINKSATTYPTKQLLTPEQMAMVPTQHISLDEALRLFLPPQQAAQQKASIASQQAAAPAAPAAATPSAQAAAAAKAQADQAAAVQRAMEAQKAAAEKAAADKAAAEKAAADKAAAEKAAAAPAPAAAAAPPSPAQVMQNYYLYKMMTSDRRLKKGVGRKNGGKAK